MGLLDRHLTEIAERMMEHIDLEEVTKEVLNKLIITDLELYFVVKKLDGQDEYEFIGMAYSKPAAKLLAMENSKLSPCKIIRFDMGKLVALVEKLGAAEDIS